MSKSAWILVHGDSTDVSTGISSLGEQSVDLIFADPPYRLSSGGSTCKSGKRASVDKGDWDVSQGLAADHEWNLKWLAQCQRILKPSGTLWVSGTHHVIFSIGFAMQTLGYHLLNQVTWFKPNAAPNLACRFLTHSTETILWAAPEKRSPLLHTFNYSDLKEENGGKQMRDVWTIPTTPRTEKEITSHPTQKPLKLLERIVLTASSPGDVIVDPFAGSATTGVAATTNGRMFVGWELNEEYYRAALQRLEAA